MNVKIKDLKKGDEIIISCHSNLKYLRLLRDPVIGKKIDWRTKDPMYKSVKCSSRKVDKQYSSIWRGKTQVYTCSEYECTPEDHNVELYQELNGRTIWLVNRH